MSYDFHSFSFDCLLLSSGPGNPELYPELIGRVKKVISEGKKAVVGIGLGHQIWHKR